MTPLVSIIIPSYNAACWLAETLESALAQTWPACEIIVVDDGSSDASVAVAQTFVARGVQVRTQANAGAAAARNAGLQGARGAYVQFLDADDLLAPDKIERQVRLLQQHGDDCIATCAWGRFTTSVAASPLSEPQTLWRDLSPGQWMTLAAAGNLMMATATWLLPRAIVDRIGPWDTAHRSNPLDDMEYFDRARVAARLVLFTPGTRTYYRSELAGSLSRVRSTGAWNAMSETLHRSADRLLGLEDSPAARRALADMFQRFVYELYPAEPALAVRAQKRIDELGGSTLAPEWGPSRRRLAGFVGWKLTKRLHNFTRHR